MRRTMMLMLFIAIVASQGLAQGTTQKSDPKPAAPPKSTAALPTVDQILDKYVQAIGGKAAIEKLTTRSVKGAFELPAMGVTASFETIFKAPDQSLTIIDIPGYGIVSEGFDGKIAWVQDPASGMRDRSGVELAAAKLDSVIHKEIRLKLLYPKLELKGIATVGTSEAYEILATPTEGDTEKWFFDTKSGLLIRTDLERETPQGKLPFEMYQDDYREVDGVKISFTSRFVNPSLSYVFKTTEIKHNIEVDETKFAKPKAN